jgi:Protein of unknown function (DUF541)
MKKLLFCALATALTTPISGARAQFPMRGEVSASGSFEVKKQADLVRIQIEMFGKGVDLKEALAKLKTRRVAAQKFFEGLGVPGAVVDFSNPKITTEKNPQEQHMRMMMRMQMQQGKPAKAKAKEPPPVVVSCEMKAEVPLAAAAPEDQLLAANALEERVKSADLGGSKSLAHVTAQDDEQNQEEMENQGEQEPKRGTPIFIYVSKLTEDEQSMAIAQAFKKAKRQAGLLAKAAGAELGSLQQLYLDGSSENYSSELWQEIQADAFSQQMYQRMFGGYPGNVSSDRSSPEAVGLHPGKVIYRVGLTAGFGLGKK